MEVSNPMKKKLSPRPRKSSTAPAPYIDFPTSNSVPAAELYFYAQSFHKAAKTLAGTLEFDSGPFAHSNICPVVSMYRHALELHLKALILGDGGNFLAIKPDSLSIRKSHSVSWLAQFVAQIVVAVKWEEEFKCEGVENLADFRSAVEALNSVDPGFYSFRLPFDAVGNGSDVGGLNFRVREFARKMDALLVLLDATADALAATWDMQNGGLQLEGEIHAVKGFGPTIH